METVSIKINGQSISVSDGASVATAIYATETAAFRLSVFGDRRFPLCGMGVCFECRVSINGEKHQRSCQILAAEGMMIETDE